MIRDIEYALPYPAIESPISNHVTYLDTIGRPILTFTYKNLTPKHAGNIYVSRLVILCFTHFFF